MSLSPLKSFFCLIVLIGNIVSSFAFGARNIFLWNRNSPREIVKKLSYSVFVLEPVNR